MQTKGTSAGKAADQIDPASVPQRTQMCIRDSFYEWLDSQGAEECGSGLASLVSTQARDQMVAEIQNILKDLSLIHI